MYLLAISNKDLIYYAIIFVCLIIIAIVVSKISKLKKKESKEVVVHQLNKDNFNNEEGLNAIIKQMQENIDNSKEASKKATEIFEEEQEENAIISYHELVRANKGLNVKEEPSEYKKDIPEYEAQVEKYVSPISVIPDISSSEDFDSLEETSIKKENSIDLDKTSFEDEILSIETEPYEDVISLDNEKEESKIKEEKKFKTTDFISPIYGTMKVSHRKKEEIKEDKQDNDEFLQSLKHFRSNL